MMIFTMPSTSIFHALSLHTKRLGAVVFTHRKLMIITIVTTVAIFGFGHYALELRNKWIKEMLAAKTAPTITGFDMPKTIATISATPWPTDTEDILGDTTTSVASYDVPSYSPPPLPDPTPFPTFAPLPTSAPVTVSTPPLNCAGTAKEYNSQVYVSAKSVAVGATSTISIELRDCKNTLASNDSLRVTIQNGDASVKLNGQSAPITLQALNGKASFTVTSQVAGANTFLITDTNQGFPVTMPGYHNPVVTFTTSATPTPTATNVPTPTPTAGSTPIPTATPTPITSPTSTPSPATTPSPTPI